MKFEEARLKAVRLARKLLKYGVPVSSLRPARKGYSSLRFPKRPTSLSVAAEASGRYSSRREGGGGFLFHKE